MSISKIIRECYSLLISLCVSISVFSQGIGIGEKCPDVEIRQLINYKAKSARLSDFMGKPLIIDFWSSFCTSCLTSLPALDSIASELGDKLQVLLVNYESEEKIISFFKKIKGLNNIKLISVVADSVLTHLFPHKTIPHDIWINKDGIVQAITAHEYVTRERLIAFSQGKQINLPTKNDNLEYSLSKPILLAVPDSSIEKYSCLTPAQPGISGRIGVSDDKQTKIFRAVGINVTLVELYKLAFDKWSADFHINRIVKDSLENLKYVSESGQPLQFCYDLMIKNVNRKKLLNEVRSDLDKNFRITSSIEKQKRLCLIMRRTSEVDKLKAKDGKMRRTTSLVDGKLIGENILFNALVKNRLNWGLDPWAPYQVIDETGYKQGVDFQLPEKFTTLEVLNEIVKPYDVEFRIEEREMDVIILKDNK